MRRFEVAFRVDASLEIGTGHVMRCLNLADGLADAGARCHFISREHPGHVLDLVCQRGHRVTALPFQEMPGSLVAGAERSSALRHSHWLGTDAVTDAKQTSAAIGNARVDWLVTDHYALDRTWESSMRSRCGRLMVIDDLADRRHDADLLLDQNLGRGRGEYAALVSTGCELLIGPEFALLGPDFARLRPWSLARRSRPKLDQLLVTMGGVDQHNATEQILCALRDASLPANCRISVVMGLRAPWVEQVRVRALEMPWATEVVVGVSDMAQRMASSSLCIGAAGSTSWERCCLGLPTLMIVLAENQRNAALHLERVGAVRLLEAGASLRSNLVLQIGGIASNLDLLRAMSESASAVTHGLGVSAIVERLAPEGNRSQEVR